MNHAKSIVAGLVILAAVVGCSQTAKPGPAATQPAAEVPAVTTPGPGMTAGGMDFMDVMARQAECTFADAVRGVAMVATGQDVPGGFEAQYRFLLDKGAVRPGWNIKPEQWVDQGTLAFMLYRAMALRGGVNMVVFASWGLGDRRYAFRELRYRGVLEHGSEVTYVTGPALVTALTKADEYMLKAGKYALEKPVELGEKPQRGEKK